MPRKNSAPPSLAVSRAPVTAGPRSPRAQRRSPSDKTRWLAPHPGPFDGSQAGPRTRWVRQTHTPGAQRRCIPWTKNRASPRCWSSEIGLAVRPREHSRRIRFADCPHTVAVPIPCTQQPEDDPHPRSRAWSRAFLPRSVQMPRSSAQDVYRCPISQTPEFGEPDYRALRSRGIQDGARECHGHANERCPVRTCRSRFFDSRA